MILPNKTADNLLHTDRQTDIETHTNIQNRYNEIEREGEARRRSRGPEAEFGASRLQTSYCNPWKMAVESYKKKGNSTANQSLLTKDVISKP